MKGTARSPPAWWGSLSGRGEVTGPGRSPWLGLAGPPHCTSPCVSMRLMLTGRLLCAGRYSGCPGWGKGCVGL